MRTDGNCAMKSWGMAAGFGVLAFLLLLGKGAATALFLGALTCVLLGLIFTWLFCARVPEANRAPVTTPEVDPVGAGSAASGVVAGATVAREVEAAQAEAEPTPEASETPTEVEVPAEVVAADGAQPVAAEPEAAPKLKPSTPLAGEAELSERKGSWTYSKDGPGAGAAANASAAAPAEVAAAPAAVEPEAETAVEIAHATAKDPAKAPAEPKLKPSTPLAGEAELSERKGSWTYSKDGPGAGAAASSAGDPAPTPAPAPDQSPASAPAQDYDKDGLVEGTGEGSKPVLLEAPQGGEADDLKQIKGIGPKLEKVCHSMGIYHFHQIAGWSDEEVAWADANMVGFKGRVSRDNWRDQARTLADGGETEFSTRVEKGGVY